ncbi:hypothetical protein [Brevundimonas sp.]|uniref:hypothetical protein n=1 Tax=Brevundimonas sp. TaxID=1871086 RepID=UPI002E14F138|nr:hypothetical protein [Brevundimonas sp.]
MREADYFIDRMREADSTNFQYEMNAFLAACRAVPELIGAELKPTGPTFRRWWKERFSAFQSVPTVEFFFSLRNFSLHRGAVSMTGGALFKEGQVQWTYRFAGHIDPVPEALVNRDACACCTEHLALTAALVIEVEQTFPLLVCPTRSLASPQGLDAIGISLDEAEESLGLPRGWTDVPSLSREDRHRLLRQKFAHDAVDFQYIRHLATREIDELAGGDLLINRVAARIEERVHGDGGESGDPFLTALFERIAEVNKESD